MGVPVLCYGLGPVGIRIGQRLATRPGIDVVAAVDIDPAKAGADFGQIISNPHLAFQVAASMPDFRPLPSGVAVHATSSRLTTTREQLIGIMDAGWNVVSTCEELTYPKATDPEIAAELDQRAHAAGLTILGTGINPGFLMDSLVLVLSGACTEVRTVTVRRVVNTDNRRLPLQIKAGVGISEQEFRLRATGGQIGHVGLRQSAHLVASRLGWAVDDYEEGIEPVVAADDTPTAMGVVAKGFVLGQRQRVMLRSQGRTVVTFELEMSAGASDKDAIHIEGVPEICQQIQGGVNGDLGTEALLANLVPVVADSRPGLLTMADILPLHCTSLAPV